LDFLEDFLRVNAIEEGAIFAGISLGGVVAQKLASRKKPKGLILISSFSTSKSVSPFLYLFKPILSYLPAFIFDVRLLPTFVARFFRGKGNDEAASILSAMMRKLGTRNIKNMCILSLDVHAQKNGDCPILSIHGEKDRIIRSKGRKVDYMIKDGGHIISISHHEEVNKIILDWVKGFD
jgi:pimeloyl-ACP methyl ester carboxylesterase